MTKPVPIHCKTCSTRGKSVFCDLSADHLHEIDSAKTTNHYKSHQVIFYEGNQPYGLYCVSAGKIKIYKMDADGHQQIVRLAGPGDIMGYRCLLAGQPYTSSAETLEESEICFVDKKTFFQILGSHPTTAFNVMTLLATDLGRAERQIANMVHKNIRERLAELFLVFKNKYGEKTKKGVKLNITLTREEIAELIGTTQESVIRLISEFKQDNLITVAGREITLLDLPRLTETANLAD
ncbi:MAG: Crp/Fnr family transcriptional regulator [Deltaproteobacteria bacterium]|nr:Crp/Fnr family transcriptional regulator [Deltaproteobacteria bacterium]